MSFIYIFISKNQTFQIIFVLICSLINETSANTLIAHIKPLL